MKNWKKALAGLLAICLMMAVVGCAPATPAETTTAPTQGSTTAPKETTEAPTEPKDPVVLEWYYRGNGQQKDTDEVEEAVNELLKEYPGLEHVSINLNCFPSKEYPQQIVLAQSSDAQMDLVSSVSLNFYKEVGNGTWMPMDDYITDTLKEELPGWLWEMGQVNGVTYMVPNYQNAFNAAYILIPAEYMEKYGNYDEMKAILQDPKKSITEKATCLEEFALNVRKGEGNTKYLASLEPSNNFKGNLGFAFRAPQDIITDNFAVVDGQRTVEFVYEQEFTKSLFAIYADWFDKGLYSPDGITTKQADYQNSHMMDPISCVFTVTPGYGTEEQVVETNVGALGFDVVAIKVQGNDYILKDWAAGGTGISSTCENPEEAALFLEAITCGSEIGKKIYNTIVFGIEGKHYNFVDKDNDRIETIEYTASQGGVDTSYAGLKWILGNSFYAYKNQAVTDTQYPIAKELNESPDTVSSSIIGFTPDLTNIQTQVDQIKAVVTEYYDVLFLGTKGSAGWEATYNEFMDKVAKAGLEEVKAELQSQLDAYFASK